jgi:hypothetical protein
VDQRERRSGLLHGLLTQLTDPGKLMRWGMAPLDPKLWDLTLSMFNPNTYIRWPMAALDPRAWNLMGNMSPIPPCIPAWPAPWSTPSRARIWPAAG